MGMGYPHGSQCHAPNVFGTMNMEKVSRWNQREECTDYPYVKNECNAHHSHLSHKNDYPGERDECWHLAVISHMRTAQKQKNPKNDVHLGMRKECKLLQSNSHTRTTKEEERIEKWRRKKRIIFSAQMSNFGAQCWHSDILNSSTIFEAIRHMTIPSWSLDRGLSAC